MARIAQDYRDGVAVQAIYGGHRISHGTMLRALRLHGVPQRGSGARPKPIAEDPKAPQVLELRRAGASLKEIAVRCRIAVPRARRIAYAHGLRTVPKRPREATPAEARKSYRVHPTKPKPQPVMAKAGEGWTWFDYMEVTNREFAAPHHLRKGPEIKKWLIANGVKP
jgi:hypothetical protein